MSGNKLLNSFDCRQSSSEESSEEESENINKMCSEDSMIDEDACQVWGNYLEQHHEDYNPELMEIIAKFQTAFRQSPDESNS